MEIDREVALGDGTEAVEAWLDLRDEGDAGATWERTSTLFRQLVTAEQWAESLRKVDGIFGRPVSRTLSESAYQESVPGAPDGHYVVLQYESAFERKQNAKETAVAMLDADGEWRVGGYFVQ